MSIIALKGKVKYPLTLDPSVWIFDDRKVDLDVFFENKQEKNELEDYTKDVSKHWDKELLEGSAPPEAEAPSRKKYLKEILLTGTFGIPFKPFLKNAEPFEDAKTVIIEYEDGETAIPFHQGLELILKFSQSGKPLTEDGPVHVLFGDGTNIQTPIKRVKGFRLES